MTQKLDCYSSVYRVDICEEGANKSHCRNVEILAVNERAGKLFQILDNLKYI